MKIKECPYNLKSSSLSPESLINVDGEWQVFWLTPCLWPSRFLQQWHAAQTVYRAYSYGDSAGITPASHFNPDTIGNHFPVANVVVLKERKYFFIGSLLTFCVAQPF